MSVGGPSDAQGRLLALVHDRVLDEHGDRRYVGLGRVVCTHSAGGGYFLGRVRVETTTACVRGGWLDIAEDSEATLTDDGVVALAAWRERIMQRPAAPAPVLTDREREIVALAARAHDLGYTLAPLKSVRVEANRLRRAGWFGRCWIANDARGLVPTPMALVEVQPARADLVGDQDPPAP